MTWRALVAGARARIARRAKAEKRAAEKAAEKAAANATVMDGTGANEKDPAASAEPISEGGKKAPKG